MYLTVIQSKQHHWCSFFVIIVVLHGSIDYTNVACWTSGLEEQTTYRDTRAGSTTSSAKRTSKNNPSGRAPRLCIAFRSLPGLSVCSAG